MKNFRYLEINEGSKVDQLFFYYWRWMDLILFSRKEQGEKIISYLSN